jgi:hypothetical protein
MEQYERGSASPVRGLEDVRALDRWAREFAAIAAGKVKSNI